MTEFDPSLGQSEIASKSKQEPVAKFSTYKISNVVANDRACGRRGDCETDIAVVGACINSSNDKDGLARQRDAHTLQPNNTCDSPVAVGRDDVLQFIWWE